MSSGAAAADSAPTDLDERLHLDLFLEKHWVEIHPEHHLPGSYCCLGSEAEINLSVNLTEHQNVVHTSIVAFSTPPRSKLRFKLSEATCQFVCSFTYTNTPQDSCTIFPRSSSQCVKFGLQNADSPEGCAGGSKSIVDLE